MGFQVSIICLFNVKFLNMDNEKMHVWKYTTNKS